MTLQQDEHTRSWQGSSSQWSFSPNNERHPPAWQAASKQGQCFGAALPCPAKQVAAKLLMV